MTSPEFFIQVLPQIWMISINVLVAMALPTTTALGSQISLPACADHCGEVKIPYPFGTSQGCFLSEKFFIHCDQSFQPPKPFLGRSTNNLPVSNITLDGGELVIMVYMGKDCYSKDGAQVYHFNPWLTLGDSSFNLKFSTSRNKFTAVGCDTIATLSGYRGEIRYTTGCVSMCSVIDDSFGTYTKSDESCSGVGCCQTSIPSGLKNITVSVSSYNNHTYVYDFNPCSYAFVVEESKFKFSSTSFRDLNGTERLPIVLNWAIGKVSCDEAKKSDNFTCKADSKCVDAIDGSGYLCQCLPGYEGNPYLPHGCQDIDECKISNSCHKSSTCQNLPGNWTCICPNGYTASETGCNQACGSSQSQSQSNRVLLSTAYYIISTTSIFTLVSLFL